MFSHFLAESEANKIARLPWARGEVEVKRSALSPIGLSIRDTHKSLSYASYPPKLLSAQLARLVPGQRGHHASVYPDSRPPTQEARVVPRLKYLAGCLPPPSSILNSWEAPASLFNVFLSVAYTVVTHRLHNVFQKYSRSFRHIHYLYSCEVDLEFDISKYLHHISYEYTQLTIKKHQISRPR